MSRDILASFDTFLADIGQDITLKSRSEGAVDDYGDPSVSYTETTIRCVVEVAKGKDDFIPEHLREEVELYIHTTSDINALDRVVISSVEYEVVEVKDTWGVKTAFLRKIKS